MVIKHHITQTHTYKSWTLSVQIAGTLVCESHWISILTLVSKYNFQNWLQFRSIDNIWDQFLADHKILEMSTLKFWNCYTHSTFTQGPAIVVISESLPEYNCKKDLWSRAQSPPQYSYHRVRSCLFICKTQTSNLSPQSPSLAPLLCSPREGVQPWSWLMPGFNLTLGVIGSRFQDIVLPNGWQSGDNTICM